MAKRAPPSAPQPAQLTLPQIRAAIPKLERRISELRAFNVDALSKEDYAAKIDDLEVRIDSTLVEIFGNDTVDYQHYRIGMIDGTPLSYIHGTHIEERKPYIRRGVASAISRLETAISILKERLEDPGETAVRPKHFDPSSPVFVIHGRDDAAKTEVARLIERAGLTAVILHEQANAGRTIIEKFEDHGSASGFAVAVVTPDDVGGLDKDNLRSRARQNVIGEMFWFAGRFGRSRVCAPVKGDIEMPSDFAGVGYTRMDERGAWKSELLRELDEAGYKNLDWRKALA